MSDDDLWRPKEPAADNGSGDPVPKENAGGAGAETDVPADAPADAPADDAGADDAGAGGAAGARGAEETQPVTGGAPPPSSPYGPPAGPGAVPPPHNPFGQPPQDPYAGQSGHVGQDPGYPGQAYGAPGYAPPPNPYPSPQEYGAPQNPYGSPYQPAYAGGVVPDHPSATTAMVLGIIGLVGIALCGGLTLVLSPAAWAVGAKAVREIEAAPGRYAGRDRAQAGKVMGIIGTVLLALGILAVIAVVVVVIAVGTSNDPSPTFPSPNV